GDWRILRNHIVPQLTGFILVQASLATPSYILAEITRSYLGLGVPDSQPSWGNMLSFVQNLQTLLVHWCNLTPIAAFFTTSLSFQLLSEGLRRRFDPHRQDATIEASLLS